jgi:16S rRNA A1518/A1519 N6-dimethyltransferase RsmA/KsgA/DIM1 with predicted DNA glycosylase/AP lyase activity
MQLQTFVEVNMSFDWPVKLYWPKPKVEVNIGFAGQNKIRTLATKSLEVNK